MQISYKTSSFEKIIVLLIFLQWMIYENIVLLEPNSFGGNFLLILVFGYKLLFPFCLLLIVRPPSLNLLRNAKISIYLLLIILFILWSLIPTLISGNIFSWLKIVPLFVFLLGVISFFSKHINSYKFLAKLIIIYVLIAVIQFSLLYITQNFQESGQIALAGPYGLFGNIQGKFGLPGINFTIIRLCGFWREPSLASGTCYVGFYLGKYLVKNGENQFWSIASKICFIAGLLTLSNAGYLAITGAILASLLFDYSYIKKNIIYIFLLLPFVTIMLWAAVFGRQYFAENGSDNPFLLAFVGVRSAGNINSSDFDPSDGRIDLMKYTFDETNKNFIGKGIQVTGSTGIVSPSGGLFFWMLLTGYPGAILILLIATFPIFINFNNKKNKRGIIFLGQALVVLLIQQSSYGSWFDPNYLILSSILLISPIVLNEQKIKNIVN
jgi:hypothetical protein